MLKITVSKKQPYVIVNPFVERESKDISNGVFHIKGISNVYPKGISKTRKNNPTPK